VFSIASIKCKSPSISTGTTIGAFAGTLARTLTQQYSALSADLTASGLRERLYAFLQGNFQLGVFFRECPDAYRRFKDAAYWRDVRQKPNNRNVMRSVLAFTMRTKGRGREALQNRVYKYARVLEYLHRDEVVSDAIPQRLKDGGGIDAIYMALCRSTNPTFSTGDSSGWKGPWNQGWVVEGLHYMAGCGC
jgi:hypothetical protein